MASFVDTNILVYALIADIRESRAKVDTARALVAGLIHSSELRLSAQVLSEFAMTAMKKGKPPLSASETLIQIDLLSRQQVVPIDASLVRLAVDRVQTSRISYWDALIVEAAIQSGATILYTEDMHHGMRYETLELRNPFLP